MVNKRQEAHKRDELLLANVDQGWQIIPSVANQSDTERLLRAAAKRVNVRVDINCWPNGETVTYRVLSIEGSDSHAPREAVQ